MVLFVSAAILVGSLLWVYRYRSDILHPAFWTNLGFVGYAVAGIYYAIFGYENAMFLDLAKFPDNARPTWFFIATLIAACGLLVCNLGFLIGDRHIGRPMASILQPKRFSQPIELFGKVSAIILVALGLAYYVYFADRVAGGIFPMIGQVGAYPYLVEYAGLSSLPFHLIYGGALLWLMMWLSADKNRWIGLIFIPVGAFVILSTGRIASANAYLFSAVLFYAFVTVGRAGWGTFTTALIAFLPINIGFYFFREYTSYSYIGRAQDFPLLVKPGPSLQGRPLENSLAWLGDHVSVYWERIAYIMRALIGGGNVPDLQQLILIVNGLKEGKLSLTYGSTYFDWLVNLLASQIGTSQDAVQSVGYRILHAYFPEKNGGPTPGMIGEAIINFGVFAPIALFLIAYLMTRLYGAIERSQTMLPRLLYCIFLVSIWALLLKVDSSLLLGYLWLAMPISMCWLSLTILNKAVKARASRFNPSSTTLLSPKD